MRNVSDKSCRENQKTHTQITAFPQKQWFRERASVLRYTRITCLVIVIHSARRLQLCSLFMSAAKKMLTDLDETKARCFLARTGGCLTP